MQPIFVSNCDTSGVVDVPGRRPSLAGHGKHDDAKPKYRQSDELKYQRVKHDSSPKARPLDLSGTH
jgi:hypothetical protein